MFEDSYHCGYFVAKIINTTIRLAKEDSRRYKANGTIAYDHDGFDNNPLFYKTKDGYECLVDRPYDRGRNWRMLYNRKNKETDENKYKVTEPAFLLPLCQHDGQTCEEANCELRTEMRCSRGQFFAHCPTFVRIFNGVPNPITMLRMPTVKLMKSDGTYIGGAGEDGKPKRSLEKFDSTPLSREERLRDLEARRRMREELQQKGYTVDFKDDEEEEADDSKPAVDKRHRMGTVGLFNMIIEEVRNQLCIGKLRLGQVHRNVGVLISDDHQYCPRVGRTHTHNHVWFIATLLPLGPHVKYWCRHPTCDTEHDERGVPRESLRLSDEFCQEYRREMLFNAARVRVDPKELQI